MVIKGKRSTERYTGKRATTRLVLDTPSDAGDEGLKMIDQSMTFRRDSSDRESRRSDRIHSPVLERFIPRSWGAFLGEGHREVLRDHIPIAKRLHHVGLTILRIEQQNRPDHNALQRAEPKVINHQAHVRSTLPIIDGRPCTNITEHPLACLFDGPINLCQLHAVPLSRCVVVTNGHNVLPPGDDVIIECREASSSNIGQHEGHIISN